MNTVAPVRTVAVALAAAALTVAALVLTHPWGERLDSSSDDVFAYDRLDAHPATWPAMMADGFALGVLALGLGVAAVVLVRERGRLAALIGAVLTVAGGVLFAMGAAAAASFAWLTTSAGLNESAGRGLVDYVNAHPGHVIGLDLAGFLLFTLGSLTVMVALLRGRVVSQLGGALFVVLTVALFVGLPPTLMNAVQAAQTLLVGAVAVPLWRSAQPLGGSGKKADVRSAYAG